MSTSCCFTPRLTGISTKFNNAFLQKKGKRERQNYKKENREGNKFPEISQHEGKFLMKIVGLQKGGEH